jgi:hypothetical protein
MQSTQRPHRRDRAHRGVARPSQLRRRLALCCTVLALAACGGNEGSTPSAAGNGPAPAPAGPASLAIMGFTPASGAAGTVVAVRGTGLDATTAATLGSAAANFRIVSAGELQVAAPAASA